MLNQVTNRIQQAMPEADVYVKNPLGDGQHFYALIVDDQFAGMPLVARQRLVMKALGDAMETFIHALSLKTYTRDEFAGKRDQLTKYTT